MSKKEEGGFFKFLFGLFFGLISGVVVGLFLAPKPGKELREDLAHQAEELKGITKEKLLEFEEQSRNKAIKVANTIQEKASKISSKLDELSKRGSEVLIQDEIQ